MASATMVERSKAQTLMCSRLEAMGLLMTPINPSTKPRGGIRGAQIKAHMGRKMPFVGLESMRTI